MGSIRSAMAAIGRQTTNLRPFAQGEPGIGGRSQRQLIGHAAYAEILGVIA